MMRKHFLSLALLVFSLAIQDLQALSPLRHYGNTTYDPNTGLEWLDLNLTLGQTYNSVLNGWNGYTTTNGFRFATRNELIQLFTDAGATYFGYPGSPSTDDLPAAALTLSLLGTNLALSDLTESLIFYDPLSEPGLPGPLYVPIAAFGVGTIFAGYPTEGFFQVPGAYGAKDSPEGGAAVALVRMATTNSALAGADILHFSVHSTFDRKGVATNAIGVVTVHENKHGNSDNQTVGLSLKGLNTNAPYTLQISTMDNPNLASVFDFTTDNRGRANLNFGSLGSQGVVHGKLPLPIGMEPLSAVQSLAVVDTNTLAVLLSADLRVSNHLQYFIKRELSVSGISATLSIQENNQELRIRLSASGLAATNDYYLVLNGGIVRTNSTDTSGRLELGTTLVNSLGILDLHSVAVTGNNTVMITTLP